MFPDDARSLLVLAHGAGAGMRHPFMTAVSMELATHGIATFRYQFPYMEQKSRRPDPAPILQVTVRSAISTAMSHAKGLPVFAGGKSMGGRMTSRALAEEHLDEVQGIVFLGFPLHPPGKPSTERGDHLDNVKVPMLLIQGTKDEFADLSLLTPVCTKLGPRSTLHLINDANHGFHVPKKSGRSDADILTEIADTIAQWSHR